MCEKTLRSWRHWTPKFWWVFFVSGGYLYIPSKTGFLNPQLEGSRRNTFTNTLKNKFVRRAQHLWRALWSLFVGQTSQWEPQPLKWKTKHYLVSFLIYEITYKYDFLLLKYLKYLVLFVISFNFIACDLKWLFIIFVLWNLLKFSFCGLCIT